MLELGYIALSAIMSIVLVGGYSSILKKAGHEKPVRTKKLVIPALGLLAWFVYVIILGETDFIRVYELPPRFPLLFVIPTFVFIGVFLYRNRASKLLSLIPIEWTVWYQSFRICIEFLFAKTVIAGLLHPEVTYLGYNHDIWFGVSAVILGVLVYKFKLLSEKIVLYWNYLGLIIIAFIIFLFTTTTYSPNMWGSAVTLAKPEMVQSPYVLVAAFLMPSAVFVHVLSIMLFRKKD